MRLSIRVRLTLLYGVMFFVAGAAVVLASYLLVSNTLSAQLGPGAAVRVIGPPTEAGVGIAGDQLFLTRRLLEAELAVDQQRLRDDTLSLLLTQSGVALGVIGVVAVGSGWLLAGRALQPIHRITATARRVADDRGLHERIALDGPADELRELADTFDAMLERLDRAFDGQRRFVANASHELRTPLAINRTLIEVAGSRPDAPPQLRELGETLLAVNARHERLIDGLLLLARGEELVGDRVPVDLAAVAEHVARRAGVERHCAPAGVRGDPVLLERVVENLVENAVRHNDEQGWVELHTGRDGGTAWVSVANTGPVVPAHAVDGLFEPFRRLRERTGSGGAGLGLSIVAAVVRAHGGRVGAEPRASGGLVVRVELPAAPVTAAPVATGPARGDGSTTVGGASTPG